MDFLPWSTFTRIVSRYGGDQRVRTLSCAEHNRAVAFAQLTWRESLRDIETCLSVQPSKLYHMGFREPVRRSTLADANEGRDWRVHAELAQRLIIQARKLYASEDLGLDLANTVYALDSTTIDLCLAVFPWAHFRATKAAVKMHTLLDLRGNIPSFIHVSDGKLHDVHALDLLLPEAGAIYVMDRGYVDFARLRGLHLRRRLLRRPRQIEHECPSRLFGADRPGDGDHLRSDHRARRSLHQPALPRTPAAHPVARCRVGENPGVPHQSVRFAGHDRLRPLQEPMAGRAVLQVDQAASADQAVLRDIRKRGENPDLDRRLGLRPRRHRQEAPQARSLALHIAPGPLSHAFRETTVRSSAYPRRRQRRYFANN